MSKAGSTYLYQILKEHPEAFVPSIKDLYFFDTEYHRGLDWYSLYFKDSACAKAVGEFSHDYIFSDEACRRIRNDLPDVKLLLCLREPVDWLQSRFLFDKGRTADRDLSIVDYARSDWIRRESDLAANLERYQDQFPPDQIAVLFYDDLKDDPARFCRGVFQFLGICPDFTPPSLHKLVLPAQQPRLAPLARFAQKTSDRLRSAGMQKIVGAAKNLRPVQRALFKPIPNKPPLEPREEAALVEIYRSKVVGLQALIDRPLPLAWIERYEL